MDLTAHLEDSHTRTHRCLRRLLEHAADLEPGLIDRELPGFGYPTLRLQMHHVLGAERYWVGVLEGEIRADEDDADHPDIASLIALQDRVSSVTKAYLAATDSADLPRVCELKGWGGRELRHAPLHVIQRVLTHAHHHLGQMQAQCRLMERAVGGLDFPLD